MIAFLVCLLVSALCLPINLINATEGRSPVAGFFAGLNVMTIVICVIGLMT